MGSANPTQDHLPIAGIQDGVVLMNDGSLRTVLKLEPINFDLKSETEQNGIIYAYQAFLNSLDFPVQFVVQSKKLDLERYLVHLNTSQRDITNDLLRIQIEDYIGFVRRLISVANIMSKRFYAVINYSAVTKQSSAAQFGSLFHRRPSGPIMDQDQFERFRNEAYNRAGIIAGGLARLGVKAQPLDTQELIELFYGIYNPDVATEERLTDISVLNAGVVSGPENINAGQPQDADQQMMQEIEQLQQTGGPEGAPMPPETPGPVPTDQGTPVPPQDLPMETGTPDTEPLEEEPRS